MKSSVHTGRRAVAWAGRTFAVPLVPLPAPAVASARARGGRCAHIPQRRGQRASAAAASPSRGASVTAPA